MMVGAGPTHRGLSPVLIHNATIIICVACWGTAAHVFKAVASQLTLGGKRLHHSLHLLCTK